MSDILKKIMTAGDCLLIQYNTCNVVKLCKLMTTSTYEWRPPPSLRDSRDHVMVQDKLFTEEI